MTRPRNLILAIIALYLMMVAPVLAAHLVHQGLGGLSALGRGLVAFLTALG